MTAGAAAQARETSKVKLLGEACSRRAWSYTAFVAETTGAFGQGAQRTVRALAQAVSLRTGEEPSEVLPRLWRTLSSAVAAAVGRQLSRARDLSRGLRGDPEPPEIGPSSSSSPPVLPGPPGLGSLSLE